MLSHKAASLGMVVNHQAASCDQPVIDQAAFANQEEGEQYVLVFNSNISTSSYKQGVLTYTL